MRKILEQYGYKCHKCGSEKNLAFIHTGTNSITSDNVKIICEICGTSNT